MRIPKFWAKQTQSATAPNGKRYALECWGWSEDSQALAQQHAVQRMAEVVQKVSSGGQLRRYGYGERPLREQVLEGVPGQNGREVAIVTRNAYGARIINAAQAMFIDIDFVQEQNSGGLGSLLGLFGRKAAAPEEKPLQAIEAWWQRNRQYSLRIYRTAAGLRCLITNALFDPGQAEANQILRDLNSDPLYITLCRAQGCFRARMTPKPWRSGLTNPPGDYPRLNPAVEARFRQWEQRYESSINRYATCRLVKQLGNDQPHPDVAAVMAVHDRVCQIHTQHPLA